MSYILQFVQKYQPSAAEDFFRLEAEFTEWSVAPRISPKAGDIKCFRMAIRPTPWSGRANSLYWTDVQNALKKLADDPTHTALFKQHCHI